MSGSNMPTGAPGFMPRRSSYASVVSGASYGGQYPQVLRSGAFAHLSTADGDYDSTYHNLSGHPRHNPRGYEMDLNANGGITHGRSGSWGRGAQLPSFSSAFGSLVNGYGYGALGGGHADHFFTPSYLNGSKYVQRLEEAHRAKAAAHKDGLSAHSSQPGSLSTSASSMNLHTKIAPSHRGMTYDLIEKAPPVEDDMLAPLPSKWNSQDKYGGLEVLSDGQEVKFTGPKSERDRDLEACAIRADYPMPSQCGIYYFEVTIISRKREESSIGIGFSSKNVPLSRLPGWEPESWAYHGDDGHSFGCNSSGKHYGPPFNAGDIIGCGINFRTNSAFFTKNGDHLGTAFRDINKEKLYPSVGMKKAGEHVRVNFGQSPFVFDIDDMMSASNLSYPQPPDSPGDNDSPNGTNAPGFPTPATHLSDDEMVRMVLHRWESRRAAEADDFADMSPLIANSTRMGLQTTRHGSTISPSVPLAPSAFYRRPTQRLGHQNSNTEPSHMIASPSLSDILDRSNPGRAAASTARTSAFRESLGRPVTADSSISERTTYLVRAFRRFVTMISLNAAEQSFLDTARRVDLLQAELSREIDMSRAAINLRASDLRSEELELEEQATRLWTRLVVTPEPPTALAGSPAQYIIRSAETIRRPVSPTPGERGFLSSSFRQVEDDYQNPTPWNGRLANGRSIRIGLAGDGIYATISDLTPGAGFIADAAQHTPEHSLPPETGLLPSTGPKNISLRADYEEQREKKQIKQQIEATSTANLAPPLSETELIQALILQFLSHDGYVETARSFAEEIYEEKKALNFDPSTTVPGPDVREDEDAGHRQRIRKAVLEGDIEKALKHTNAFYPNVLKDNEHVSFRLKCRRFIEMIRQGAEMQSSPHSSGNKKGNGHSGDWYDDIINQDMDLDDHQSQLNKNWDRMDTEEPSENRAEYQNLLQETLTYGQLLQAEYKDDPRREVGKALEDAFALMAYQDPLNAKEVAHLLDPNGRAAVAEELNSAILLSLGKSSTAALEKLIQQTTVLLEDLGEGGGPGAFVSIDDFVKVKAGTEI
ncbi:SPRY domain-containing protein [Diplocarpon rosae]|nr:SPRY domain-containing protein [Diplocarpon rosae]